MKKLSAVKSETHFCREAIENYYGKVLKENFIIGRTWSSAKLFILQHYTENANGGLPFPHEKINQCLTDINQCLTNIFKI